MTIEHAIWKVGKKPDRLQPAMQKSAKVLDDIFDVDLSIQNGRWMIIGGQLNTTYNGFNDLQALV